MAARIALLQRLAYRVFAAVAPRRRAGYAVFLPNYRSSTGRGVCVEAGLGRPGWRSSTTSWMRRPPDRSAVTKRHHRRFLRRLRCAWARALQRSLRRVGDVAGIPTGQPGHHRRHPVGTEPVHWGTPWEAPDLFRQTSPITHAQNEDADADPAWRSRSARARDAVVHDVPLLAGRQAPVRLVLHPARATVTRAARATTIRCADAVDGPPPGRAANRRRTGRILRRRRREEVTHAGATRHLSSLARWRTDTARAASCSPA